MVYFYYFFPSIEGTQCSHLAFESSTTLLVIIQQEIFYAAWKIVVVYIRKYGDISLSEVTNRITKKMTVCFAVNLLSQEKIFEVSMKLSDFLSWSEGIHSPHFFG